MSSILSKCKNIFSSISDREVKELARERQQKHTTKMASGGGEGDRRPQDKEQESSKSADGGERSGPDNPREAWYDNMEEQTDENTSMVYENRELLSKMDERTAWMMRIIFVMLTAVIGGIGVELVML